MVNTVSKTIGEKMKKKEPQGESDALPDAVTNDLLANSADQLKVPST